MRNFFKRLTAAALAAALAVTGIPAQALAAGTGQAENPDKLALEDDYISVTVSGKNGGFLIDTVEGNKLNKSDNNKFLLYPSEDYDTSYTSFSVTRADGTEEEYIFGRDYGFLGLSSSGVELSRQGNTLTAVWSVKDLTIEQNLSLLDESASQHGMVSIGYTVRTESEDVENVKVRLMLDTALGYQDYGVYELPDLVGDYTHIRQETLLDNRDGNAFAGSLFAVDDPGAPKVTAYTVNTTMDGQALAPYQVAFGHWNHLASTVFDFTPDGTLDFTNPYNASYLTADSAYALYYDMGGLTKGSPSTISTYYGVFSNATVSAEEKVAINFPSLPASMTLNEAKDAYETQVEGGRPGDISVRMAIENISAETISNLAVVVKVQNQVTPYLDWYANEQYGEEETYVTYAQDYQAGETEQVEAFFQVSPLPASEYRRFEVLCYAAGRNEELTEAKLLGSREFYLFCPGALGEVVAFNSIEPQMVYTEGTKNIYLSGQNFGLLRDTTAYVTYLHSLSGGQDVTVPARNVVVDPEKNTMYLVVEGTLDAGSYQVVFDWNEPGKEDTTSTMLQFLATDKPEYISPVYGIVTVEKEPGYTDKDPRYRLMAYGDEDEYARKMTDPNNYVLLEFRGNFSLFYDAEGNITEAKAVSLEDIEGNISNTINISNCLDVEAGSVSILVEEPGTDAQVIQTNIDGKVYTTNSRTKVWNGVCAISSIENGSVSKLLQYTSDADPADNLENSVANTNAITLIWPGAASGMQTLAGIMLEFRYCQFGMMALEDGMVTDETPKRRVIAFGAEMSPDFLLPTNFDWGGRQTSTLEAVQLKIAKSNYTAEQLRDVQLRYAQDQEAWEEAEEGSLALYVHDILFGGGFIGFNTSLEVGLPSYADGLPSVEGTLGLKIMPMDGWWEVGVAGSADFEVFEMEASLRLKTYNGIPVPDNLYFYLGGVTPGLNVDGMGIFWIQGLGGGIDSLYDTLFVSSAVPPLTLMLSGQFALFNLFQARADLNLSLRGFDIALSDVGLPHLTVIDRMGLGTYWYPKLKMNASMQLNIMSIIDGGGYLLLEENQKDGTLFWEGFATASIQTPKIPLIGSIKIGSADLGVNPSKIWGALHVLMLDMGLTYYWGGDVDFSFGKYDTPEPVYPMALLSDIPVYTDKETGDTLYMSLGTNAKLAAKASRNAVVKSRSAEASIASSEDLTEHTIKLGTYTGESGMALSVLYSADSLKEAQELAYGSRGITIKDENGNEYPLTWLDTEEFAEEQTGANALLAYDEETKQASVTVSFTDETAYGHTWKLSGSVSADLALYELKNLAGLDTAAYTAADGSMEVTWSGRKLEEVEQLSVYAADAEGELYTLYETDEAAAIQSGKAAFTLPEDLPSGSYTLRVMASSETNSVNDILDVEGTFDYVNPKQPEAPAIRGVRLGGDYSLDVDVAGETDYDGYIATIYEQQEADGETVWAAADFAEQWITPDASGKLPETLNVGGSYEATVTRDADGNIVPSEEAEGRDDVTTTKERIGLEAGKTYCVGVRGYRMEGEEMLCSAETRSGAAVMKAPDPASVTVTALGAKQLTDSVDLDDTLDTVNTGTVTIQVQSDQTASGTWSLDGAEGGAWQADQEDIIRLGEEESLEEGEHILELLGENEGGDGVHVQYRFRVDVTAPRLQFSSPADGSFFGESVTVSGLSEPGAQISILKGGALAETLTVDESGEFAAEISMDVEALEQELAVYAEDAAGNQSRQYIIEMTNEILGAADARLALYLDGEDYTNRTVPAGKGGVLELRAVSGEKSLVIPADSNTGRQVEWSVQAVEGTAALEGQTLTTDSEVNGIVLAELEQQSAGIVLGGNKAMGSNTYPISIPQDTIGYTVNTEQELTVKDGEDFTFTVEIAQGYTAAEDFGVFVNGVSLEAEDGSYTVRDIHGPKTITVEGVRDVTAPEVEISVSSNSWKEFLNTVTFHVFFKETQDVRITASDSGSGMGKTEYYIAEAALTLEEVRALEDSEWTAYENSFSITPDGEYVIYARASDQAGNTTYCSSDGLVLDHTAPAISGIEEGGIYYGDQTFTVQEDYLEEIRIDGTAVELENGSFTLAADNGTHTVEAVDRAGNLTGYTVQVYRIYTVDFVADGESIASLRVNHGGSVEAGQFPAIPEKYGYDKTPPVWNPASLENVTADQTVQAVYTLNRYQVTLPEAPEGYTVHPQQGTEVEHGGSFRFTVEIAGGYTAGNAFRVFAGGRELTASGGVYTISDVQGDVKIRVEGVAKEPARETPLPEIPGAKPPEDGQVFEQGNYYYKVISAQKRTVEVTGVKNTKQTKLTIYNQVVLSGMKFKVTSVAPKAFKNYTKATSLTVGRYVSVIGKDAFAGCTSLKKVTVNGNSLRQIRANAFKGCKKLTKVVIKSKKLTKVDRYAFRSIHKKAVIKVPAAKYKKYVKLFAGKGMPKTVKIKK